MSASGSTPARSAGSGPGTGAEDRGGLAEFGYAQRLDRTLGRFASFAAGVSYISILTGTFQLFYVGYGTAGPAYVLSWPLVFAGQLMVALCFAELAARYPVAGSVYNWAKKLGGPTTSWMAGWMMLSASVVTLAAVVLAYQITLPQLWSGFQVVGDGTGPYDYAVNAVVLGSALVVFVTVVNACGVRLMSRINSAGVFVELVAAVLLIVLLAASAVRGPGVVTETNGFGGDRSLGYLGAFLVASLASGYVMYGFDTASSLGEETVDPRRTAPAAILRALVASFVLGGLILLFGVMAVRDPGDPLLSSSSGGLQHVVLGALGGTVGKVFLACIAVAITVCALAVHTATIRTVFAMARDDNLPASARLARLHPRFRTPVTASVLVGVVAVAILLVNVRQPQIFTVVTSIAVVMIYASYLLVTVPMLLARLRGTWPPREAGGFTLGRWGLPVNAAAVLWGAAMALNLAWPRREVYNAVGPQHWYLQWGAFVFVGAIALVGLTWYAVRRRSPARVLPEHAAVVPPSAAADGAV
ncbi:APC family permease [Quadrisphaera sp. DSM 44207]|uniref:APC family permease n=1 Tax=Quadrisphaera sp. DSM 44207 TaxID=1881057 RepID=UPI000887D438|nr:amino acid permease [Quadrisphaera sp. DSM 44207]SDQ06206.1 amino acid/polyamine/organocation transporter, APC superfamily [Quadrisphaera sp. DSM 44207]